ncbi:hypothetical protein FE257_008205 [Aspergillus nanangensis]|uniref:Transcription factor domain-containing protein n=1 Tax=Aspergillus nanangensis TaxID=2582783 RepID=A0AAD4GTP2_ASPNN|nr:hypothetical protein FE257_008205 [Aspergillus nanangensis]
MLTLLLVDAQQGASAHWRCHLDGVRKIIALHGGMRTLAQPPGMEPLILFVAFAAVMGDTSSPASNLTIATAPPEDLDFIIKEYGDREFALGSYPTALFVSIIKINRLRMQAACRPAAASNLALHAYAILTHIHSFSSADWAQSKPVSTAEWVLLGNMHQAAVAIYCIRSLQSVGVLPRDLALEDMCAAHGRGLQHFLQAALPTPQIRRFTWWCWECTRCIVGVAMLERLFGGNFRS